MPQPQTILETLQREIVLMQGHKPRDAAAPADILPASVTRNFYNNTLPLNGVHEFFSGSDEDDAATGGFISAMLSTLLQNNGTAIWVSRKNIVFPPALAFFGIAPHRIIFLQPKKEKDLANAVEESLKCSGITAVVGEIPEIDLTGSRRLQLTIEKSGVSCFLLRRDPRNITTSAVARWKIGSLPATAPGGVPGVGFPCWKTELLKVRNGKTGKWELEWYKGKFRNRLTPAKYIPQLQTKTG